MLGLDKTGKSSTSLTYSSGQGFCYHIGTFMNTNTLLWTALEFKSPFQPREKEMVHDIGYLLSTDRSRVADPYYLKKRVLQ